MRTFAFSAALTATGFLAASVSAVANGSDVVVGASAASPKPAAQIVPVVQGASGAGADLSSVNLSFASGRMSGARITVWAKRPAAMLGYLARIERAGLVVGEVEVPMPCRGRAYVVEVESPAARAGPPLILPGAPNASLAVPGGGRTAAKAQAHAPPSPRGPRRITVRDLDPDVVFASFRTAACAPVE